MGLDTVELVMGVEKHFDITIPDEIAEKLFTVGLLHEYICSEHQRLGRQSHTSQQVFDELIALVAKHSGIDPAKILAESRFVDDLRMD